MRVIKWWGIGVVFMAILGFVNELKPTPYPLPEMAFFPDYPPSENSPTIEGVELGRHLFYDPILSKDSTISCASCHQQQFAFSDAPKAFSTGITGKLMTRNTMPLFNLVWYPSFFWDGKSPSLEEQVFHPVRESNEMGMDWKDVEIRIKNNPKYVTQFQAAFGSQEIDSFLIAKAIAQFEKVLISQNSKYDQVLRRETYFTEEEYAGFVLMNDQTKGDCLHCHVTDGGVLGTTGNFSNNGLDKATAFSEYSDQGLGSVSQKNQDAGKFKIPSLRNVAVTAPYMHDGRFKTLDEVLDFYSEAVQLGVNTDSKMGLAHQGGVRLTVDEKKKIKAFLLTLTDSSFISNPQFSNPFN